MYVPRAFREDDPAVHLDVIRTLSVGMLISQHGGALVANLVPFEAVAEEGKLRSLRAHLARANTQWQSLDGQDVLVVFQGPNAYVSPRWYPSKREHGKVVPTWNYAVVQVRGKARVIEDRGWLLEQVSQLTDRHEQMAGPEAGWKVGDAPDAYIEAQLKGIVGIEILVTEVTGKLKVSQNRPAADQAGVAAGYAALGGDQRQAILGLMKRQP